eukprot:gene10360-67216_t
MCDDGDVVGDMVGEAEEGGGGGAAVRTGGGHRRRHAAGMAHHDAVGRERAQ